MKTKPEIDCDPETWLWHGCRMLAVFLAFYIVSVGPAYRLCVRQVLPRKTLAIYRPLISIKSPFFHLTCKYMVLWI